EVWWICCNQIDRVIRDGFDKLQRICANELRAMNISGFEHSYYFFAWVSLPGDAHRGWALGSAYSSGMG
ncbi:hypothetical protein ACKUEH_25295, partial [Escherichia coli]|uniref:hypothetical protein n=1 Tax=Escherichia coli TaxID=562 RepID=UPI00390C850D